MRKEFKISIELDVGLEDLLYNIRWNHIDIEEIIQNELEEYVEGLIRVYGEVR